MESKLIINKSFFQNVNTTLELLERPTLWHFDFFYKQRLKVGRYLTHKIQSSHIEDCKL